MHCVFSMRSSRFSSGCVEANTSREVLILFAFCTDIHWHCNPTNEQTGLILKNLKQCSAKIIQKARIKKWIRRCKAMRCANHDVLIKYDAEGEMIEIDMGCSQWRHVHSAGTQSLVMDWAKAVMTRLNKSLKLATRDERIGYWKTFWGIKYDYGVDGQMTKNVGTTQKGIIFHIDEHFENEDIRVANCGSDSRLSFQASDQGGSRMLTYVDLIAGDVTILESMLSVDML